MSPNINCSDSEFEEISYADLDSSVQQRNRNDHQDETSESTVVVDFPPRPNELQRNTSFGSVSTTESMFRTRGAFAEMQMTGHNSSSTSNNNGDNASWSVVQDEDTDWSTTTMAMTAVTHANKNSVAPPGAATTSSTTSTTGSSSNSIVSNFEILSISGESKRKCCKCKLLNEESALICGCCGISFVANPFVDVDKQIALNLKRKEEDAAFQALREQEILRSQLKEKPLEERAQVLSDDLKPIIRSFFSKTRMCRSGGQHEYGKDVMSDSNALFWCSQFIKTVEALWSFQLAIGFHATLRNSEEVGRIGFGFVNIVDLSKASSSWSSIHIIEEDEDQDESPAPPPASFGWVVAYIKPAIADDLVEPSNYLPLFRFRVGDHGKEALSVQTQLARILDDFFVTDWQETHKVQMNKRPRTEPLSMDTHEQEEASNSHVDVPKISSPKSSVSYNGVSITNSPLDPCNLFGNSSMETTPTPPEPGADRGKYPLSQIDQPHADDVLFGAGDHIDYHIGNLQWRRLVAANKKAYAILPKAQEAFLSKRVVQFIRSQNPPGRFLQKDEDTGLWFDIGDDLAQEKTSLAFQERRDDDFLGLLLRPLNADSDNMVVKQEEKTGESLQDSKQQPQLRSSTFAWGGRAIDPESGIDRIINDSHEGQESRKINDSHEGQESRAAREKVVKQFLSWALDRCLSRSGDSLEQRNSGGSTGQGVSTLRRAVARSRIKEAKQSSVESQNDQLSQAEESRSGERSNKLEGLRGRRQAKHWRNLANSEYLRRNFNEAIHLYSNALVENKEDSLVYSNRAMAYLKLSDYRSAIKDADQCIRINRAFAKGYVTKARALGAMGHLMEKAIVLQEGIANCKGNVVDVKALLGMLYKIEAASSDTSEMESSQTADAHPTTGCDSADEEEESFLKCSSQGKQNLETSHIPASVQKSDYSEPAAPSVLDINQLELLGKQLHNHAENCHSFRKVDPVVGDILNNSSFGTGNGRAEMGMDPPTSTSIDEDCNWLSEQKCFVRSEMIEFFTVSEEFLHGSYYRLPVGAIGLRCKYCSDCSNSKRALSSVEFPPSVDEVYQRVIRLIRHHLPRCNSIPSEKKAYLSSLDNKDHEIAISKKYFEYAARKLGLANSWRNVVFDPRVVKMRSSWSFSGVTAGYEQITLLASPSTLLERRGDESEFLHQVLSHLVTFKSREMDTGTKETVGLGCEYCFRAGRGFGSARMILHLKSQVMPSLLSMHNHLQRCNLCPEEAKLRLKKLSFEKKSPPVEGGSATKLLMDRIWSLKLKK